MDPPVLQVPMDPLTLQVPMDPLMLPIPVEVAQREQHNQFRDRSDVDYLPQTDH